MVDSIIRFACVIINYYTQKGKQKMQNPLSAFCKKCFFFSFNDVCIYMCFLPISTKFNQSELFIYFNQSEC